jgi:hypothetical protein
VIVWLTHGNLSIPLSIHPSVRLSVYLSIYLSIYLPIYLSIYLPSYLLTSIKSSRHTAASRCEGYPGELSHLDAAVCREDFIEFCNSESFKAYTYILIHPMQLSTYVRAYVYIMYVFIYLASYLISISLSHQYGAT